MGSNQIKEYIPKTRVTLSRVHTPPRPNSRLMKPHLNSLEPNFYLDLHQMAHTHKCKTMNYTLEISIKIFSNVKEFDKNIPGSALVPSLCLSFPGNNPAEKN